MRAALRKAALLARRTSPGRSACATSGARCVGDSALGDLLAALDWNIDALDLSTPFTAVGSVREGAYLLRRGLPPYASPICRHPFLLLQLLDTADRGGVLGALLLGAHVLTAWGLSCLVRAAQPHGRRSPRFIIGVVYLLSPWNVAACATRSSAGVSHLLTAVALLTAHTGATAAAAIAAALAAYTAPDAAWLLPAIALLCASRQRARCGGGLDEAHVARFGCWCAAGLASLRFAGAARRCGTSRATGLL